MLYYYHSISTTRTVCTDSHFRCFAPTLHAHIIQTQPQYIYLFITTVLLYLRNHAIILSKLEHRASFSKDKIVVQLGPTSDPLSKENDIALSIGPTR
jgi:hypothetical protein